MITPTWRASGAPCDSCGLFHENTCLTVTLSNKKAPLGYRLPDLTMCRKCRYAFERAMNRVALIDFPGHPPEPDAE